MRITFGMTADTSLRNIQNNQQRMADYENQLTSGSQLTKPSDDPIGIARALNFQQSIDQSDQYIKNINQGSTWLASTDAALGSVTADLLRAQELTVQAANGTLNPQDKKAIQMEVSQLQASVLDLSNATVGSSYLFSGTRSDKPGYQVAVSSVIDPTAYQGNAGTVLREISPGVTLGVNAGPQATFDQIFKALATIQNGLVPQATAPAVSTAAITTGSAPSPAIGTGGILTINGVAVTIATGNTPAQSVTAINGTAGLGAAGSVTASLVGGNLTLTSNTLGSSAYVAIGTATGVGNTLYTDLGIKSSSASGLDDAPAIQATLQQSLVELGLGLDALNVSRAGVGAKMNRLTTLQATQTSVGLNLTGLLSQVKDTDMAAAITAFTMSQTVYQASLKVTSNALQPSLLDFLK
jgi:flagellar hook-associated protein 3 FlgL